MPSTLYCMENMRSLARAAPGSAGPGHVAYYSGTEPPFFQMSNAGPVRRRAVEWPLPPPTPAVGDEPEEDVTGYTVSRMTIPPLIAIGRESKDPRDPVGCRTPHGIPQSGYLQGRGVHPAHSLREVGAMKKIFIISRLR